MLLKPDILTCYEHQAGADRIQLDISQRRPEVRGAKRAGVIAALPNVP